MEATENLKSALEAILFTAGDSVEINRIGKVLGAEPWEVRKAAEQLSREYEEQSRGVRLVRLEEKLQTPAKIYYKFEGNNGGKASDGQRPRV